MSEKRAVQLGIGLVSVLLAVVLVSAIVPSPVLAFPANDFVSGCTGEYFNNTTLAGSPVLVRTDPNINFYWPAGTSPGPGVTVNYYSVRWTCTISVATDGTYTFTMVTDDGMNLLVDGNLLIWAWYDQGPTSYSNPIYLYAGTHTVVVQYYNDTLGGTAQVYSNISGTNVYYVPPPPAPVPVPAPAPAPITTGFLTGCTGEYFNNISLSGSPTFVRADPILNFYWPEGTSPGAGIGIENYSVRWTCPLNVPTTGTYTFNVLTDDGMNVWVDGSLVIGQWHDQPPAAYASSVYLNAGAHSVIVQYYNHTRGGTAEVATNISSTSVYYPPVSSLPYSGGLIGSCTGEYFNNTTLAGSPVLVRTDPNINFYWPAGTSPGPGVTVSQYSVRWTCTINATTSGTYTVSMLTDDGMNVLVDGNLIIWAFYDQGPSSYSNPVYLDAGTHTVVVEYYNNTLGGTAQVSIH